MPELPEVEHVCRYLRARVVGARIRGVTHLDWPRGVRGMTPAQFRRAVAGARIAAVERRAKLVLLRLEGGRTLAFHLMMTGKLWAGGAARPPDAATRAVFALEGAGARELRFEDQRKFGWFALFGAEELERHLAPFGPDALAGGEREIAAAIAARRGRVSGGVRGGQRSVGPPRASRAPGRTIKTVLLDQRVVAGIGNIYADEILFAARVHPAARVETLSRPAIRRVARASREVMAIALARREGEAVPDQKRVGGGQPGIAARLGPLVYQRTGEPCERCGRTIERIVLGGRATHFCPRCQR